VSDQDLRSLHRNEWLLIAASAASVALFFVVGFLNLG
jgi:hypothetical protein